MARSPPTSYVVSLLPGCCLITGHFLQYRAHDQPWYRLGHGVVLAYITIGLIASILFAVFLKKENYRRDRGDRDEIVGGMMGNERANEKNGRYDSVESARREKGDAWSGFRYAL